MSAQGTEPENPQPSGIHTGLLAVMRDVQVLRKESKNRAQGFSFRGIDAVLNAVGPKFREYGIVPAPEIVSAKHRDFTSKSGTLQHEAILEVRFTFYAADGSFISCSVMGEASDSSDKATTQAMSVAYRTALLQLLCLPTDTVDPDENTVDRGDLAEFAKANSGAVLDGWGGGAAERAEAWDLLVGLTEALDANDPIAREVTGWGKAQKLNPDTLTKVQAEAWQALLDGGEMPF